MNSKSRLGTSWRTTAALCAVVLAPVTWACGHDSEGGKEEDAESALDVQADDVQTSSDAGADISQPGVDSSLESGANETSVPEDPPDTSCDVVTGRLPIHGAKCVGSLSCTYSSTSCDDSTAMCEDGRWRVTLGQCYKCPSPDDYPEAGSMCMGEGCHWLNACGGLDVGSCTKNGWEILPGACTKACQEERPVNGSPCAARSVVWCDYPGMDCSTMHCLCDGWCPTGNCSDGLALKWTCTEWCGKVSD